MAVKRTVDDAQAKPSARRRKRAQESPSQVTVYRMLDDSSPNDPQGEREFITTESLPLPDGLSIEAWLQRTAGPGRYRAEYRGERGRVANVEKVLIGGLQHQAIVSDDSPDIELEDDELSADVDSILDQKLASLRQELLSAIQRNNLPTQPQTGIGEIIAAVEAIDRMRAKNEPQPQNTPSNLIGQLRELEEARRIFAPKEPNPRPIETERRLTTEEALLKLISEDRLALAAVRNKLLGGDDESGGWFEMLPVILPSVERIFGSISGAVIAATQRTPAPMSQNGAAHPSQDSTQQIAGEPQPTEVELQAYQRIILRLLSAMETNAEVETVISAVDSFLDLFPEHQQTIESLMSAPAEAVLTYLAQNVPNAAQAVNAPHSLEWMRKLQADFFSNDDQQTSGDEGPQREAQS